MAAIKVYLAGEGRTELGDFAGLPQYRATPPLKGVLLVLIERVLGQPVEVVMAEQWKSKNRHLFAAGDKRGPEQRRVRQLAVLAQEQGADLLVFSRDRDRDEQREADVEAGLKEAVELFRGSSVGGVAIEAIEGWILALLGARDSERHAKPKERLKSEHGIETTEQKGAVVENANLGAIPADATSLKRWLERAKNLRVS